MNSIKCPHCGLINFSTATFCQRCRCSLLELQQQIESSSSQSPSTFYAKPTAAEAEKQLLQSQQNPDREYNRFVRLALGIIVLLTASFLIRAVLPKYFQSALETQIVKMCGEMNKSLPLMVDSETRLDNVAPGVGKSFSYNYTLVNRSKGEIDSDKVKAEMTPFVTNRVLTSKEMNVFVDNKITIIYKYFDRNGRFLFEIPVNN